ncbi:MAG: triose-phosphate isomerase [Bacteroidota bacterium]
MIARRKIVAGNWKMNLLPAEADVLFKEINAANRALSCDLVVFPPAIYLQQFGGEKGTTFLGIQNFHPAKKGAFTGEISIAQVVGLKLNYVLIGHSERRIDFSESNSFIKEKVDAALQNDVKLIFCCGEPLEIRESGKHLDFVKEQLEASLFHISESEIRKVIIAYEPIWAIGTGRTASAAQAEEMHKGIRTLVEKKYGAKIAEEISILYGGSCNTSNAKELFSCPNVDGGLIGGAALEASSFLAIANSF